MEFKTVVAIYLDVVSEQDRNIIVDKLNQLKNYIVETKSLYNFQVLRDGKVFKVGNGLEEQFQKFIDHVDKNLIWETDCFTVEAGEFEGNTIDLEEGEYEFETSFIITPESIYIYLNTEDWYSSELEKLQNKNIGLRCEMNDIDGDYYFFDI